MSDSDRQAGASGQLGPKSPDSKFRETSSISSPSERLHQGADSSGFAARRDAARRDAKSAYRAERTGSKLEKAKQRQAKQRPAQEARPDQVGATDGTGGSTAGCPRENLSGGTGKRRDRGRPPDGGLPGSPRCGARPGLSGSGFALAPPGTSASGKSGTSRPRQMYSSASWRRNTRN